MGAPTSTLTLWRGEERQFRGAPSSLSVFAGRRDPGFWSWLAGGGVDAPWVVFISQKMPQMPEAWAGVRRSPCAAVTNPTPPLLPSLLSYLSLLIEKGNQNQLLEGEEGPVGLNPSFSISSIYLPRLDIQPSWGCSSVVVCAQHVQSPGLIPSTRKNQKQKQKHHNTQMQHVAFDWKLNQNVFFFLKRDNLDVQPLEPLVSLEPQGPLTQPMSSPPKPNPFPGLRPGVQHWVAQPWGV